MKFIQEFKKFAFKGNVFDMAIGVIIGGAFGKIVSSLVSDIITPLISLLTGGVNFTEMFVVLNANGADLSAINTIAAAQEAGFATLNYGNFIQTVIDFLIIAISIFAMIKLINSAKDKAELLKKKKEEETPAPTPAGPTQEELLTEIRDLLKEKK